MALYLKLDIHAGRGAHAYVTSFKVQSAGQQLPYADFVGIASSTVWAGSIAGTLDDTLANHVVFYGPDAGYLIYRYDGAAVLDAIAMDAYLTYCVSSFDFYTLESDTVPAVDDPGWQHVISHDDYYGAATDSGDPSVFVPFGVGAAVIKHLFRIGTDYYRYDAGVGFALVSNAYPTAAQFAESGMIGVLDIPVSDVVAISPAGDFGVEHYDSTATVSDSRSLNITNVSSAQIALPVGVISLAGAQSLDAIAITQTLSGAGVSRFAISVDGSSWQVWSGTAWQSIAGLTVDQAGADQLIANGMTAAELQALNWTQLQQLYAGAPTAIAIAYAVEAQAADDVVAVDLVELTVTHTGKWVRDHGQIELALSADSVTATPAIDCSYKVNYQDA